MTQADDAWTRIKVSPDLPKVYKRAVLSLVAGQPILSVLAFFLYDSVFFPSPAEDLLP